MWSAVHSTVIAQLTLHREWDRWCLVDVSLMSCLVVLECGKTPFTAAKSKYFCRMKNSRGVACWSRNHTKQPQRWSCFGGIPRRDVIWRHLDLCTVLVYTDFGYLNHCNRQRVVNSTGNDEDVRPNFFVVWRWGRVSYRGTSKTILYREKTIEHFPRSLFNGEHVFRACLKYAAPRSLNGSFVEP